MPLIIIICNSRGAELTLKRLRRQEETKYLQVDFINDFKDPDFNLRITW